MMIKDYNAVPVSELYVLNRDFGTEFKINDGKIVSPNLKRSLKKNKSHIRRNFVFPISRILIVAAVSSSFLPAAKANATDAEAKIPEEYIQYCEEIGAEYNICPELLMSIVEKESGGKPELTGAAGEIGLMQVIPKYHTERMKELGHPDLYDAYDNILVGADYLRELFEEYEDTYLVLMCYNMGESRAIELYDQGIYSDYAVSVCDRSAQLEELHHMQRPEIIRNYVKRVYIGEEEV